MQLRWDVLTLGMLCGWMEVYGVRLEKPLDWVRLVAQASKAHSID